MTILVAVLALSFLIIIHEFGHFIIAKLSGIKVQEFSLFMGPKLFSMLKGETMYSIRAVPLGGYVKMEGEEQESEDSRAFNRKPVLVRAAVIAAGPLMNLLVAIIIITAISSAVGYSTTSIGTVVPGSSAEKAGIRVGDKLVKYDGKSIYHRMDLLLFSSVSTGEPVAVEVVRGNERISMTLVPQKIPAQSAYKLWFNPLQTEGQDSNVVGGIIAGGPAEKAGVKINDRIVALNGTRVASRQDIAAYLNENGENPVVITVLRGGHEIVLEPVKAILEKVPEQYDIGMDFSYESGVGLQTVKNAGAYTYSIVRSVYYSLAWLIERKVSMSQLMGPVGIVSTIGDVVQQSPTFVDKLVNLLNFTAIISINLGVFNLIPFPALDGSKLIILAIEGIRRKAIPPEKEAIISMVGMVLLIVLMIFATSNDFIRLFTGK